MISRLTYIKRRLALHRLMPLLICIYGFLLSPAVLAQPYLGPSGFFSQPRFGVKAPVEIVYKTEPANGSRAQWVRQRQILIFALLGVSILLVFVVVRLFQQRHALMQREEALEEASSALVEAQEIAQIGSWSRNFETGQSHWNPQARKVLGLGDGEDFKHYETLVHPDDFDKFTETIANAYHQGGNYVVEHRLKQDSQGRERYIRLAGQVFLGEGASPVRETGTVQDITTRKQAEIALKLSELRLRSILEAAPYPIMIFNNSDDLQLLYANKNTYFLFEIDTDSSLEDIDVMQFWVHQQERGSFFDELREGKQVANFETLLKSTKGKVFWGMLSATEMEFGGEKALFVSLLDITDRRLIQEELERLATTDPLTGILNRRSFFEAAHKELRRTVRYQYPFCLLMLDIDYFKRVNDNYGHAFGDQVIQRFTEVCAECLREEDILGRIGGEEFAVVLVASEATGGVIVAERIRKSWAATEFEHEGKPVNLTISIGLSQKLNDQEAVEDIMERADRALYQCKESGRNCVRVFEENTEADSPVNLPPR